MLTAQEKCKTIWATLSRWGTNRLSNFSKWGGCKYQSISSVLFTPSKVPTPTVFKALIEYVPFFQSQIPSSRKSSPYQHEMLKCFKVQTFHHQSKIKTECASVTKLSGFSYTVSLWQLWTPLTSISCWKRSAIPCSSVTPSFTFITLCTTWYTHDSK